MTISRCHLTGFLVCLLGLVAPTVARADEALVTHPKDPITVPKIGSLVDGTLLSLSAGGLLNTGNSRLLALTVNGSYETRFDNNGIGAALLGNYGRGAPPNQPLQVTTENLQGKVRYDRYIADQASFFVLNTGRHDRLQGLDFRYNLDPGFKYLFMTAVSNTLWGELGYDFQYDVLRDDARLQKDGTQLPKTHQDSSARFFVGYRHAFNQEVTLSSGVEYLQSFLDSSHARLNFDALIAAKIGGGLALGFGFGARYDHAPLPGKVDWDTASTVSLIYALSDAAEPATAGTQG